MKAAEVRELSNDELRIELDAARENYFKLRFQFTTGQLTDYNRLRAARKDIARMATVLRQRQLEAKKESE